MRPTELLADGGYPSRDAIDQATAAGVTLYAPVPKPRSNASETPDQPPIDPHLPKPGDSDAVAAWRVRMGTDEAKQAARRDRRDGKRRRKSPSRHGRHRVARP